MAKTNIVFNNINYKIDESTLEPAMSHLKSHLETTMNGSGASISLGGASYEIDSDKLSAATDIFVAHLESIAGNGKKIIVNGVEYSIDASKVSDAISELEITLNGLGEERLEGDGAEYYTMAPSELSFRSSAPLSELQEVQVNGVTVDPSNYTLEEGSTIVNFFTNYLKTLDDGNYEVAVVSDNKTVKGDFTVKSPELNEHGFYYNQPYTAFVPMFGENESFFIREDGTMDVIGSPSMLVSPATYEYNDSMLTVYSPVAGTLTGTVSSDGMEIYCNELGTSFKLCDESIYADEEYIYVRNQELGGYEVQTIHKMKTSYADIKNNINGSPIVRLAAEIFLGNTNLIEAPVIPESVVSIGDYAFSSCLILKKVSIPKNVTHIGFRAFEYCDILEEIIIPEGVTVFNADTFNGCVSLKSVYIPSTISEWNSNVFGKCTSLNNITFGGTVEQWNAIFKHTGWDYAIPADYVQCSDGRVTLYHTPAT